MKDNKLARKSIRLILEYLVGKDVGKELDDALEEMRLMEIKIPHWLKLEMHASLESILTPDDIAYYYKKGNIVRHNNRIWRIVAYTPIEGGILFLKNHRGHIKKVPRKEAMRCF